MDGGVIVRTLHLSDTHLTTETRDTCGAWQKIDSVVGYPFYPVLAIYKHGMFLWVPETPIDERLPHDLQNVLRFAQTFGCETVHLSGDGATIDALPTFPHG